MSDSNLISEKTVFSRLARRSLEVWEEQRLENPQSGFQDFGFTQLENLFQEIDEEYRQVAFDVGPGDRQGNPDYHKGAAICAKVLAWSSIDYITYNGNNDHIIKHLTRYKNDIRETIAVDIFLSISTPSAINKSPISDSAIRNSLRQILCSNGPSSSVYALSLIGFFLDSWQDHTEQVNNAITALLRSGSPSDRTTEALVTLNELKNSLEKHASI